MAVNFKLQCVECGSEYPPEPLYRKCIRCGGLLKVVYNYENLRSRKDLIDKRFFSMWRYHKILPISDLKNIITLHEGWTPLLRSERLASSLGVSKLYLKDETRNPSGSFLDRGVSVEVSKAIESGYKSLTCGTTGDLGASVSAYSARSGLKAYIFVPKKIDVGKLYQMAIYNAEIYVVNSYEEALRRSEMMFLEAYVISTSNPWYLEGIKTVGYEIVEQMNFILPDHLVLSVGSGALLITIYKAIKELIDLGLTQDDTYPSFHAIQTEAVDPIVRAYEEKTDVVVPLKEIKDTIATDIAISNPVHGKEVLRILRETGGKAISVSDSEILKALAQLARQEGILVEPAGATALAGLRKLIDDGVILRGESVVLVLTGAGLKHPKAIRDTVSQAKDLGRLLSIIGEQRPVSRLGETKIRILQAVSEGNTYGYSIWKALREKYDLKIGLPTMYQHLKELEEMGLLSILSEEVKGGRKRVHYTLTERGRKLVEEFS